MNTGPNSPTAKLWRKYHRLIDAPETDWAKVAAVTAELDALWDAENPSAKAERDAFNARQVETDARAICGGFTDGDESEVTHRPID